MVRIGLKPKRFTVLNEVKLNSSCLLHNVQVLSQAAKLPIIPVLKSNAYGHGIHEVAKILNTAQVELVSVDSYHEAEMISPVFDGKILVMGYISSDNFPLLNLRRMSYIVQSLLDLRKIVDLHLHHKLKIHIEINTGMNRTGLNENELSAYLKFLQSHRRSFDVEGVMTHLMDADNTDSILTTKQTEVFDRSVKIILDAGFNPRFIHMSATAGIVTASSKYANYARSGIGIFGINPVCDIELLNDLQPVMEVTSTVVKTFRLKMGDRVSYNGAYTAQRDMRIAVLPFGYYEGLPRSLSNGGELGNNLHILGKVNMNHVMIDISNNGLNEGEKVTIISRDKKAANSIDGLCKRYNIFPYELLTHISNSIRRVII